MTTRKLATVMPKVQDRTIDLGGYKFDEKKHAHTLDGKPLYGVTTVLKVLGKGDALVQWSANMAVDYVITKASKEKGDHLYYRIGELELNEARKAWCKTRDTAGGFGTNVHDAIEKYIKHSLPDNEIDALSKEEAKAVMNFIEWSMENNITFKESEKHVHSKEMWVGGILDLVFVKDGKTYIGDIKTSKGIYPEYFYQMGAYDLCLQEMGLHKDIDGYAIINLKKTGEIQVEFNYGRERNQEAFKHCLALHKLLEETKKTI
jgi:hypothetical protein